MPRCLAPHRERKGRDVFVIGAANVGKSAFVRAMLREMSQFESVNFDAAAMSSGKYLPVESAMPGTTLGLIPLQAFESGGTLYDTPGELACSAGCRLLPAACCLLPYSHALWHAVRHAG